MGGLQKLSRSSFSSKLGRLCWSLHSPAISRLGNALLYEAIIPTLFYSKYTLELNLLNSEVAFYHPTLEKRQSQHISPLFYDLVSLMKHWARTFSQFFRIICDTNGVLRYNCLLTYSTTGETRGPCSKQSPRMEQPKAGLPPGVLKAHSA